MQMYANEQSGYFLLQKSYSAANLYLPNAETMLKYTIKHNSIILLCSNYFIKLKMINQDLDRIDCHIFLLLR